MDATAEAAVPRFAFGRNWAAFLVHLDDERIRSAEDSVQSLVGRTKFTGLRFLDIGSGSGLFSMVARRLGARVHSFDYDSDSVECARELRRRYFPDDADWIVEQGSVLDTEYVASLGTFDVVYSWGVLHHTGAMWRAVGQALTTVAPGGTLVIALYNCQPVLTPVWKVIKRTYVALPRPLQGAMALVFVTGFGIRTAVADLVRGRNPFGRLRRTNRRGMSFYHDVVDWIGGWPFEAARPDEVTRFVQERGFTVREVRTVGARLGCNEFVFQRSPYA
jgi:2-polyprenyl-6-hydroxyphenyl methylase/3-demethylubiquinone-9 3-methyltransferase